MTLEQMKREAALLQPAPYRLTDAELARLPESARRWLRLSESAGPNGPKAAFGPFRQMLDGGIMLANQTAITGTSETAMFSVAQYSGFAANQLRAGQIWHLTAFGIMTTAGASPGNITITPRFGTSTSGTSLGASAATALATSASNVAWRLEYDFIVRTIGNAGANSTVVGNGKFITTVAAIAAATGNVVPFGSTASVSVDTSVASGLFIGVTMGSASDTMTTMGVMLESYN
jgi:hypothetical protein